MWPMLIGAGMSLIGSKMQSDAQEKANEQSRALPPWLQPYMTGQGQVPGYLQSNPQVNTNWMNAVQSLGQGAWNTPWQPMTPNSQWFNQDQTFTPEGGGGMPGGGNQQGVMRSPGWNTQGSQFMQNLGGMMGGGVPGNAFGGMGGYGTLPKGVQGFQPAQSPVASSQGGGMQLGNPISASTWRTLTSPDFGGGIFGMGGNTDLFGRNVMEKFGFRPGSSAGDYLQMGDGSYRYWGGQS